MYRVDRIVVSESTHPEIYGYLKQNSLLANNLYNAALFRVRQIFTGWNKTDRTSNEVEIFNEIKTLAKFCPAKAPKRKVISYRSLEKLMRATNNPDFFAGLPMQTAQDVLKQAVADFTNWLAALKTYKVTPEKFLGKPKMPHYKKKSSFCTFTVSNQDAVLYPIVDDSTGEYRGMELKLPMIKERMKLSHIPANAKLKEVKVKPYYGKFLLLLTYETETAITPRNMPNKAAIDFGTDNIAAIVTTDGSSRIYKGGAIISENRWFAKEKGRVTSIITKGTKHKHATSKYLQHLSLKHDCFMLDQLHKISRSIVDYCVTHNVGMLVIGKNENWKQNINIGKVNNQNFVAIPHAQLEKLIQYKAEEIGIEVIAQEESYTSKADVTSGDAMPVYQEGQTVTAAFSGRRVQRGLYKTASGAIINADCNGAANILRKLYPEAWNDTKNFTFLARPEVINFKTMNKRKTA